MTYVALQPAIVITNYLMGILAQHTLLIVTFSLFSDGLTFGLYRIQNYRANQGRKGQANAQLNLLWQKMSAIGLVVTYMTV